MKKQIIVAVALIVLFAALAIQQATCLKLPVPTAITIYSESRLASNIETRLQAGDTIYFCGE